MSRGRLQRSHVRVGLDACRGSLGDEVPQRADLHALLAEAGQDVGHVRKVGLVRTDEQHAAAAVTEAGVGVEEVGGAVQRDDGLARTRTTVDDERAAGSGADDRVLVGLDGAEHVSHPGRSVAAQARDKGGLVVERGGVPGEPVRGEHLVPVVADPAAGPAIPAAAGQTHRVGVGRAEERLSGGGAPVEQEPATGAVGEAKSSDVHGLGVVGADDVSEAQVQTEATQRAQASGQPVDLQVAVHRRLAVAAGRFARGIEAVGQVGDRLLEGLAMAAKCCSSPAISAGSALAARWSGRANALVVTAVTSSAPICREFGTIDRNLGAHEPGRAVLQRRYRNCRCATRRGWPGEMIKHRQPSPSCRAIVPPELRRPCSDDLANSSKRASPVSRRRSSR